MKLKESTFAIIAEKQNSISHKWFEQNANGNHKFAWGTDKEWTYLYNKGNWDFYKTRLVNKENYPICTELEFEALLKSEQENEGLCLKELEDKLDAAIAKETKQSLEEWLRTDHNPPPPQVIFTYQTAIDLLAYYTKIDKGIIKIEMP